MSQVQPQFDPNDPKYICCCGCHVLAGAKILTSISTVGILIMAICTIPMIDQLKRQPYFADDLGLYLCIFLIVILSHVSLWYGIIKEREAFLIPTLICMVIGLVLIGVFFILSIFAARRSSLAGEKHTLLMALGTWVQISISFALQYWFFSIYKNAYYYIKHKGQSSTGSIAYIRQP
uniref:DUF7027 domain-containing protein n=1 Tax=Plectus sambesii TaxID=2011161 RepID=A0A914VLZ6_9BILA